MHARSYIHTWPCTHATPCMETVERSALRASQASCMHAHSHAKTNESVCLHVCMLGGYVPVSRKYHITPPFNDMCHASNAAHKCLCALIRVLYVLQRSSPAPCTQHRQTNLPSTPSFLSTFLNAKPLMQLPLPSPTDGLPLLPPFEVKAVETGGMDATMLPSVPLISSISPLLLATASKAGPAADQHETRHDQ